MFLHHAFKYSDRTAVIWYRDKGSYTSERFVVGLQDHVKA
jgi:hypothetical protein